MSNDSAVIRAARSPIQGWGVFARRRIYPGTIAERCRTIRVNAPRYTFEGVLALGLTTLLNHSDDPNCQVLFGDGWSVLKIKRRIERGQELTTDYECRD
jgi:SET domain-containing protein